MNPPITLRGAREHHLKNLDLELPSNKIIALMGPSGSGKSTLAFDTLFAESRRRFLDCLSPQTRQLLAQPKKADFDSLSGLPPALCLEQSLPTLNSHCLLGSITEILDYLRLLYAAIGIPHDPHTGTPLIRQSHDSICHSLSQHPEGTRLSLLAPLPASLQNELPSTLRDMQRQGFLRIRMGEDIYEIDELLDQPRSITQEQSLELVIDRIILRGESSSSRLADSLETAFRISPDEVRALIQEPQQEAKLESFLTRFRNPETGFLLPDLSPRHFSFNSPYGQCPACKGAGCAECQGTRLNPLARSVTLSCRTQSKHTQEYSLPELCNLELDELHPLISQIRISTNYEKPCAPLLAELNKRLQFLCSLGIGYLQLSRPCSSLSGGELQRARLAGQLGSGLSGVLYILDEPSIGLHTSDTEKLIQALQQLRDLGNSIIIVEHDPQLLAAADYLVDMGPGSGKHGGEIMAQGSLQEIIHNPQSLTGAWLAGINDYPAKQAFNLKSADWLQLKHCSAHTLKNVTLRFPLASFTCIDGPSGSGKSTLLYDCLIPALKTRQAGATWGALRGAENIARSIIIDQSAIGKSARSTPATATGLLDILRPLYASLPLSKQRGYKSSRFSTMMRGGRCERCQGTGQLELDLQFLEHAYIPCDACHGARYNRETLDIAWRGKSIAEALAQTVDEAIEFFAPIPKAKAILQALQEIGLGYLELDRPAMTLSGGESQRIKIASQIARVHANAHNHRAKGKDLIILDEPSSGLHYEEVKLLLKALFQLRDAGNSILCIEHHTGILAQADYLITLGPEAGAKGGQIISSC